MEQLRIVLGVSGADCHAVGNQILERFFLERGFVVTNLGVMVSQYEFIDAAVEMEADAILVSSLYGHAEIDCSGLRERCVERGLDPILLYIGGNLLVGKHEDDEVVHVFREMGFDRVFPAHTADLHVAANQLRDDILSMRALRQGRYHDGA